MDMMMMMMMMILLQVDGAIQETKNLMNAIAKVVTTCFVCATKVRDVPWHHTLNHVIRKPF